MPPRKPWWIVLDLPESGFPEKSSSAHWDFNVGIFGVILWYSTVMQTDLQIAIIYIYIYTYIYIYIMHLQTSANPVNEYIYIYYNNNIPLSHFSPYCPRLYCVNGSYEPAHFLHLTFGIEP